MTVNIYDGQDSLFNEDSIFKNVYFTIFTIVFSLRRFTAVKI